MKISHFVQQHGANLYSKQPVLLALLHWAPNESRELSGDLVEWIRSAYTWSTPADSMDRSESLGSELLVQHITAKLHRAVGLRTKAYPQRIPTPDRQAHLIIDCDNANFSAYALSTAMNLVNRILANAKSGQASPIGFEDGLDRFVESSQAHLGSVHTRYLINEALQRGIPVHQIQTDRVVFGNGCYQQLVHTQKTERTGHLACKLATDKRATNGRLRQFCLPVPSQYVVQSAQDAIKAAHKIGFPVVVKPLSTDTGVGVSIHLNDDKAVHQAFEVAEKYKRGVIVEEFIEGSDHRLLVIDEKLVAAAKRVPAHVIGDGLRTIEQLVEAANRDPRRGSGHLSPLTRIKLDDGARRVLQAEGYDPGSVPDSGEQVYLRRLGNLSQGGISVDLTDCVHPENEKAALLAARAVGLDIAGVDFLLPDISRSWRETGGAICEINPGPGLRMHFAPAEGKPRDVAGAIFESILPADKPSRVPVAAITGSNGKTTTTRLLARILSADGSVVGMVNTTGVYVGDECLEKGDKSGGGAAARLLQNPLVESAVLEIARGSILNFGTGLDSCNVAAVMNVMDEHLGDSGVETPEDMAQVKGLLVELAKDAVVLNADDPLVLQLAKRSHARRIAYVSMSKSHPVVSSHIAEGGLAVRLESESGSDWVVLYDDGQRVPLIEVKQIPSTWNGIATHNTQNAMFAAIMAYSLGTTCDIIERTLRDFQSDSKDNPGRLNKISGFPFQLVIDQCHNRHNFQITGNMVDNLPIEGRRLIAFTMPGGRRDEDYVNSGLEVARHFDFAIVFPPPPSYLRGRSPDDFTNLLKQGLLDAGFPNENIQEYSDHTDGLQSLIRMGEPDDFLLFSCWSVGPELVDLARKTYQERTEEE